MFRALFFALTLNVLGGASPSIGTGVDPMILVGKRHSSTINSHRFGAIGAIIFVHGLDGEPFLTFTATPKTQPHVFWPQLMKLDTAKSRDGVRLSDFDIWTMRNETTDGQGIQIQANRTYQNLINFFSLEENQYRHIIVICHSLGGLLAKSALVQLWSDPSNKETVDRIHGLSLIATPSQGGFNGSGLKGWFVKTGLTARYGPIAEDLKKDSSWILGLEQSWTQKVRQSLPKGGADGLSVFCLYETEPLGNFGAIVTREQAITSWCSEPPAAIKKDHITIVKPESLNDDVYLKIRGWIFNVTHDYFNSQSEEGKAYFRLNLRQIRTEHKPTVNESKPDPRCKPGMGICPYDY